MGGTIVVGAGPAGLAVAAALTARGVTARLLDRSGQPGGAYRAMYDELTLSSPSSLNGLPGLALKTRGEYTTAREYRAYLERFATSHRLTVEYEEVLSVERDRRGFRVLGKEATRSADFVVVASGMWDSPRHPSLQLEGPGRKVLHGRAWFGPESHPERRVLIVGSGTSAVEIAEELARAGRMVSVSARSALKLAPAKVLGIDVHHWIGPLERLPWWMARGHCEETPTPPATDGGFGELRAKGRIRVLPAIARADEERVHFVDGTSEAFDLVVTATGFTHATPFLDAAVARARGGHVVARRCESVSWPGLFVIGSPCASGLASPYLRGMGADANLIADRIQQRARGLTATSLG